MPGNCAPEQCTVFDTVTSGHSVMQVSTGHATAPLAATLAAPLAAPLAATLAATLAAPLHEGLRIGMGNKGTAGQIPTPTPHTLYFSGAP